MTPATAALCATLLAALVLAYPARGSEAGPDGPVPETPDPADILLAVPQPRPSPPLIGALAASPQNAHCLFKSDEIAAAGDDTDGARHAFIIERVSDGQVAVERGYARIDGLTRELVLLGRQESENGEERHYRTWGDDRVEIVLTLGPARRSRAATAYAGASLTATRDGASIRIAMTGSCAPDAANRRARR